MSIRLPEIHEGRLDNGLRVAVATRPGVPLAAARLLVRAGSSLDPRRGAGLAHLVALAARRGAGRRSGEAIDDLVESLGADLVGGVEEDASAVGLSAPVESLPRLLAVLADVASRPTFPVAEVERIRRRELAELAHDADEPGTVADRALVTAVFADHPYGHPADGTARDLRRLRRGDLVAFQRRFLGPGDALLVVAGPVDPARTLAEASRLLGSWRPAETAPRPPAARRSARRVIVVDRPDATQSQVRIAGVAFPRVHPDWLAGQVGNAVLGGGFTSRLVEAIRVNRGLSYGVRSRFASGRVAGSFSLASFTKNESVGELVAVAFEEMERFAEGGPTGEEIARAGAWMAGLLPLSLETHDQWADRIGDAWVLGYDLGELRDQPERIRGVDAAQARDAVRRHLPLHDGVVLAVGPARLLEPQLSRFGPVEIWPVRQVM